MIAPPLTAADLRRPRPSLMWFGSLVWVALLLLYAIPESDGVCDGAYGCPPDQLYDAYADLYIATVLVLPVLHRVGTAVSCVLGLVTVYAVLVDPPGIGVAPSLAADLLATVAVLVLWALEAERRRPEPGPRAVWDGPPGHLGGRGWRVTGWVLGGAAALLVAALVPVGVYEHHRESSARVVDGEVVDVRDDGYDVVVRADGQTHDVDVGDTYGWSVGEVEPFFVDADGPFRYADEPFSVTPGLAIAAALAALAAALVARGAGVRRADGPGEAVPVRSVRVAPWGTGALVFPAGAVDPYAYPLLSVGQVLPYPVREPADWPAEPPEPALVYGLPRRGRPVRLRTRDTYLVGQGPAR